MRKETHMTYEQAFEYVGSFTKSGTPVKDLIRFVILMRLLGNPQNELKIVHVAGRRQRSESPGAYFSR